MSLHLPDAARGYQQRVEEVMERWLGDTDAGTAHLVEAMRYGVLGQGKRLRPLLCYFTGEALGLPAARLDGAAAAVEMIHAYSLIHDDLPAMDDDDLRRGRPSCHRAFGEATAILAGDALQTLAFEVLASEPAQGLPAESRLDMIRLLAQACGVAGMAGGQAMDLASQGRHLDPDTLAAMHARKTGALIRASVLLAAAAQPRLPEATRAALERYARDLGLAFQIHDDILDVEGDTAVLGKQRGSDESNDKATYPALLGLEEARRQEARLTQSAIAALEPLGERAAVLRDLARSMLDRKH